jgi:hypothetical protein
MTRRLNVPDKRGVPDDWSLIVPGGNVGAWFQTMNDKIGPADFRQRGVRDE